MHMDVDGDWDCSALNGDQESGNDSSGNGDDFHDEMEEKEECGVVLWSGRVCDWVVGRAMRNETEDEESERPGHRYHLNT